MTFDAVEKMSKMQPPRGNWAYDIESKDAEETHKANLIAQAIFSDIEKEKTRTQTSHSLENLILKHVRSTMSEDTIALVNQQLEASPLTKHYIIFLYDSENGKEVGIIDKTTIKKHLGVDVN